MSEHIDALRSSLAADPENWETRFNLIHALHQQGETNDAVALLSEITSLPSDDRGIIYAAQSYQILGANEQAQSVYESALGLNPNNEYAIAGLRSLGIEPGAAAQPLEPVALTPDAANSVAEPDAVAAPQTESRPARADGTTPPPVISKDDTIPYDPETAGLVDHIHEAEEASRLQHKAAISKDRINAVIVTILVHLVVVLGLMAVIQKSPRRVPPQIVASSSAQTDDAAVEQQVMKKNSLKATSASESAADILSVPSVSAISMASLDSFQGADIPVETGMTFQPSMSMGMPSSSQSMMMFGEPMEGETLGVVLDVSGSMAEWLPLVIREVDKNFDDAPIVYITKANIEKTKVPVEIRPIVGSEVTPKNGGGAQNPYWFLFNKNGLSSKAPQRSVDRLIETFRTRTNQFLAVGLSHNGHGGDKLGEAMKFLAKEKCDAVYVFSDFEDFIDEDIALEHGRALATQKVRAYIQPAVEESEFIKVMAQKVANRTKGRQLPTLSSVIKKDDDEKKPLVPKRPTDSMAHVPGTTYASPRADQIGKAFYDYQQPKKSTEITRLEEREFDAVFYGPTSDTYSALAAVYLKDNKGAYIQRPIEFGYHCRKSLSGGDKAYRWRPRKFIKMEEPPSFDGKEIIWKMLLEDNVKFRVHLYLDRKGMNATYVVTNQPVEDDHAHNTSIRFRFPKLALEKQDRYYGQDLPEGLKLDEVRQYARPNKVVLNLPRAERSRNANQWAKLGFEPGYNTRSYDELFTQYPNSIRDIKVSGPSFGDRIVHARTTSSKVLLHGWGGGRGGDTEPWEGFSAGLHRSQETRTKFTKTEAIALMIE